MPKKKIKIGVINEPPPTPVRPTTSPTKNPASTNAKSCIAPESEGSGLYCKLLFYDFVILWENITNYICYIICSYKANK